MNMRIQAYLIAAAVNLKRLAATLASIFHISFCMYRVAFAFRSAGLVATI